MGQELEVEVEVDVSMRNQAVIVMPARDGRRSMHWRGDARRYPTGVPFKITVWS